MIQLSRKNIVPPVVLTDKNGKGYTEAELAKAFFSSSKKNTEKFKFEAYRDQEVKSRLIELSWGKCAYCESKEAGSDYDIEHFRPKGKVTGSDVLKNEKGYYWLAADWENLFLSCQHCNQSRVQEFIDGSKSTSGKKNFFPLLKGTKRVTSWKQWVNRKNEEEKARLLLDPVNDDPAKHLFFKVEEIMVPGLNHKRLMPLIDAVKTNNHPSEKGNTSIKIFGLNRKQLAEVRLVHYNSLKDRMDILEMLMNNYDEDQAAFTSAKRKERKKQIEEKMMELVSIMKDKSLPYTAMAAAFINPFLEKWKPWLQNTEAV